MNARVLRGALFAAALCASSAALAQSAACDTCADLCGLVDQLQQKEKGIELWRQYAASTPASERRPLPAGVTDSEGIENHVWNEFSQWAKDRKQNDQLPCKLAPQPPGTAPPAVTTDLTTSIGESCQITYKGKKLEGQVLKDYETDTNCKVMSDATIAHETVHQEHCMRAYYANRDTAPQILDAPENVAESELQSWSKHRDVLRDGVRALAGRCGWEPTKRQRSDPDAVPSTKQTKDMQARGWKAVKALKGAKP